MLIPGFLKSCTQVVTQAATRERNRGGLFPARQVPSKTDWASIDPRLRPACAGALAHGGRAPRGARLKGRAPRHRAGGACDGAGGDRRRDADARSAHLGGPAASGLRYGGAGHGGGARAAASLTRRHQDL